MVIARLKRYSAKILCSAQCCASKVLASGIKVFPKKPREMA